MVRKLILMLLSGLALVSVHAEEAPIGRTQRLYADEARLDWSGSGPRPLDTTIWYPAEAGTPQRERTVDIWRFGRSQLDASVAGTGRRPLVLVSHGAGGSVAQLGWLAERLLQDGYIVAGVNHHGNNAIETPSVHGFVLPTERAFDLSVLLDSLLADPVFGPLIDVERIGAAGFSFGGYTVLASAGVTLDYEEWWDYCRLESSDAMCTVPPEADFTLADVDELRSGDAQFRVALERNRNGAFDSRIRAVFALAPALLTRSDLSGVQAEVAVILADEDDQVPLEETLQTLQGNPAIDVQVINARHYTFLAPCTALGRWFAGDVCRDPRGVDRDQVHEAVAAQVRAFFANNLR